MDGQQDSKCVLVWPSRV